MPAIGITRIDFDAFDKAANGIVETTGNGQYTTEIGPAARIIRRKRAGALRMMQRLLAVIDRLLPRPGGIGEAEALGSEARRPSLLTRASDRAALRNNEL